jgi:hypothetical protein
MSKPLLLGFLKDILYAPSQKTMGLPVDECANDSPIEAEGMGWQRCDVALKLSWITAS